MAFRSAHTVTTPLVSSVRPLTSRRRPRLGLVTAKRGESFIRHRLYITLKQCDNAHFITPSVCKLCGNATTRPDTCVRVHFQLCPSPVGDAVSVNNTSVQRTNDHCKGHQRLPGRCPCARTLTAARRGERGSDRRR